MAEQQSRPLGAQISHMLKDRGVEVIFGIPGVHNQEMYRGIEEAGLQHVLARHEQGAGFMADGYARATGRPGVAYVITGPGLCNIMTPLGQAYSDSVPVLVLASCLEETGARRGQLHQMLDQTGAAATVCDWSLEARTAPAAYGLIDRALAEFQQQRPRPKAVHVAIPLLEGQADPAPAAPAKAALPAGQAPQKAAQTLAAEIAAAKRPLAVFGGGVGDADAVRQMLAAGGMASFVSYAGRGLVATDDPLAFGAALARPGSADVLGSADLVLVFGSELAEVDIWRDTLGHGGRLVRVDIDPEVLADGQGADATYLMDADSLIAAIGPALDATDGAGTTEWRADEVAAARKRWQAEVAAEYPAVPPITEALRACLPAETMIYSDMTQFAYGAKEIWDMDRPGHWHHPSGFGTLGYATPAAIGGAIGRPGLPTMAIIGDYGFHYTMAELGVAVELGLPLPILLWDNGKLGAIEASMVGAQIAPNAVVARNPDFVALARAFGAHATAPSTLSDLQEAVTAAFAADGPTLIHVTPEVLG